MKHNITGAMIITKPYGLWPNTNMLDFQMIFIITQGNLKSHSGKNLVDNRHLP